MQTYNHDIVWLNDKIVRFIFEAVKAGGANTSGITSFSLNRMKSYLSDMRNKIAVVQSAPDLDLPESTPSLYDLREPVVIPDMENDDLAYIARLFSLGRLEMINSQSGRMGAKLKTFDEERLVQVIGKIEQALASIEASTELDLPESSPRSEMTGDGRKGI